MSSTDHDCMYLQMYKQAVAFSIINVRSRTTFWAGLFTDMADLDGKADEFGEFHLLQLSQREIEYLLESLALPVKEQCQGRDVMNINKVSIFLRRSIKDAALLLQYRNNEFGANLMFLDK